MLFRKKLTQLGSYKKYFRNVWSYILVAVVLVWLGLVFIKGIPGFKNGEATLIIALGSGEQRIFQGEVVDDMTILDALRASSQAGQIDLEFIIESDKTRIEELNGYLADQDAKLSFYLNGSKVEEADIHTTTIDGGDTVEIRPE
ncbi:MAG: hypothetical protein A3B86_00060 [Candidatus Yanofskybacteria bacterium RIFCSPHIGHO2_02_FULL_38_22b]|uniref:DUF4430 domain-containing protein n=1 Tax=Candidatus Yanofskybacteria bacterium RIFCSPHIGHO2_02_FULL_38_22b TaxID=1802673 RepID=A0A1F8F2Z6_9BACT|nr:MAG: hypothetical protein A2816_01000 [Candidatus Yanofskybacteria bacterium RIFCSPHIGHO2_01_FULL_39_44]OGN06990.1 MAG: hypothetical protein A3B86_00060 [Candidatus Yanofskybacteria bacterium RIFCSPHIGHO2_02_FULL_38_22b]